MATQVISNVRSAYHEHVVDDTGSLLGDLFPAAGDHLLVSDTLTLSPAWSAWTDPLSPPKLPDMSVSARFGERVSTDADGAPLSSLIVSASTGSRADDMDLPDFGVSAAASHETLATGSPKLPTMSLEARSGIRCGTLNLPTMSASATVQGSLIGTLDKQLPGLTVAATGSASSDISLDASLPALDLSITMSAEVIATLSASLPALLATAVAGGQWQMTLNSTLPALTAANSIQPGSMTLSGTLPTLVTAQGGTWQNVLQAQGRYDDYVLRHVR